MQEENHQIRFASLCHDAWLHTCVYVHDCKKWTLNFTLHLCDVTHIYYCVCTYQIARREPSTLPCPLPAPVFVTHMNTSSHRYQYQPVISHMHTRHVTSIDKVWQINDLCQIRCNKTMIYVMWQNNNLCHVTNQWSMSHTYRCALSHSYQGGLSRIELRLCHNVHEAHQTRERVMSHA